MTIRFATRACAQPFARFALVLLLAACADTITDPNPGPRLSRTPHTVVISVDAATLAVGETIDLDARLVNPGGREVHGRTEHVWSSTNPIVATVDQRGVVTAVSPGSATITATYFAWGKTGSAEITVVP